VGFSATKDVLDGEEVDWKEILATSFNGKIISLFLLSLVTSLLFVLLYVTAVAVVALIGSISTGLAVLIGLAAMVFVFVYMIRFIVAMPILIMEDVSIIESLKRSLETIPMRKGFKYLLIGFVGLMAFAMIGMVVGLIFGLLSRFPVVGSLFTVIGNVITTGLTMTLSCAVMMGLYYKYRGKNDSIDVIEDHLVYDN